jgi:hypothetical protein
VGDTVLLVSDEKDKRLSVSEHVQKIWLCSASVIQGSHLHTPLRSIKKEIEIEGFTGSYTAQLCALGRHPNMQQRQL